MKKKLFIMLLCIMFNICDIDSESYKKTIYNLNDYSDSVYILYLKNINSNYLKDIIYEYDLDVYYYVIDDKKYYVNDISNLVDSYSSDMSLEEKIYYSINGVNVDRISLKADRDILIKLENLNVIY